MICHSKYWNNGSQPSALATLTPSLFCRANRTLSAEKLHPTLDGNAALKNKWEALGQKFDNNPIVRVLAQSPAKGTKSSKSTEGLHKNSCSSKDKCSNPGSCASGPHAWLYTINVDNVKAIFEPSVLDLSNHRKGLTLDDEDAASSDPKWQRKS